MPSVKGVKARTFDAAREAAVLFLTICYSLFACACAFDILFPKSRWSLKLSQVLGLLATCFLFAASLAPIRPNYFVISGVDRWFPYCAEVPSLH